MADMVLFPDRWDPDAYPLRREMSFVPPETLMELARDAVLAGAPGDDLPVLTALIGRVRFVARRHPPIRDSGLPGPSSGVPEGQGRAGMEAVGAVILLGMVPAGLSLVAPMVNLGIAVLCGALVAAGFLFLVRRVRLRDGRERVAMQCLSCEYDLKAAHQTATVVELGGAAYELCRCPECGLLWPTSIKSEDGVPVVVTVKDTTPIDAADLRLALVEVRMALGAAEKERE